MPDIFKCLIEGRLTEQLEPSVLDKSLALLTAEFEDFCLKKLDGKTANEILRFLDKLVEVFSDVSSEKFFSGVKTGIALSKESQDFVLKNFKPKA